MTVPRVKARPAATVVLLRDTEWGIEVLMVRRAARGYFGGLTAFPGGAVDPEDSSDLASTLVIGDGPDLNYRVAALRELAEETGLALTRDGLVPAPSGKGVLLLQTLKDAGLQLDGTALTLVSRWVTPIEAPNRFDTRFFLARADQAPEVRLDTTELVDHIWLAPSAALSRHTTGEIEMFLPTIAHLRWLERRTSVEDAVLSAQGADGRSLIQPRRMDDGSSVSIHVPAEM